MQLVSILCFHLLSSISCLASLIISFLASLSHLSEGKDLPWRLQSDDRTFLFYDTHLNSYWGYPFQIFGEM